MQRIADEKAAATLQRAKNDILEMLKGGQELDTEQQAFALEHDLYEVLILGQNAAKLLKEEEELKQKKLREQMLLERAKEGEEGGPEEEENEEEFKYEPGEGGEVSLAGEHQQAELPAVSEKRIIPMGSNGRPKVHRKGRRMAGEGRWVDRPPPSATPPTDVVKVEKPTEIFDRKGKPLKKRKSKRGRRSKNGSGFTSRATSRAHSPVQGLQGIAGAAGGLEGETEEKKATTPADKVLKAQSDSRRASRRASKTNSRRPSITWERRASRGELELPAELLLGRETENFNGGKVKLAPIMATPKYLAEEEKRVRQLEAAE